jgi:hypothetical protein
LQDLLELLEELYARHFACYNYWGIVIFVVGAVEFMWFHGSVFVTGFTDENGLARS